MASTTNNNRGLIMSGFDFLRRLPPGGLLYAKTRIHLG
jgi:hypothetical protein